MIQVKRYVKKLALPSLLAGLALLLPASFSSNSGVAFNAAVCSDEDDTYCCREIGSLCNGLIHWGYPPLVNNYDDWEGYCDRPEEEEGDENR